MATVQGKARQFSVWASNSPTELGERMTLTLLLRKVSNLINIWTNIWYQISDIFYSIQIKFYIKNTWFALSQTSENVLSHDTSRREISVLSSSYPYRLKLFKFGFSNKHNLKVWGDVFPFPNTWHLNIKCFSKFYFECTSHAAV